MPQIDSRSRRPTRIVYVESNTDGTIGGSYFSLYQLVTRIDRARFRPLVVFSTENELIDRFRADGVEVIVRPPAAPRRFRIRALGKAFNFFLGWVIEPLRIATLLRRVGTELLHLNNSITRNDSWILAAIIARIPCVTHERGINADFTPRVRWLARSLRAVICISEAVRTNLVDHGLGHLPLRTIHNGLDLNSMQVTRPPSSIRAELQLDAGARLLGLVGNIRYWKGQEVAVKALARIRADFPEAVCLLIGDTARADKDYHVALSALVAELGLEHAVRFTGYRVDVSNYVNALEVQIHASIDPEPFGRVLLEAMALGKPLVASRGGAVPEIVLDGVTGLLFEPGNEASLACCLATLLSNPERAVSMGERGRERVEQCFSMKQSARAVEDLYTGLGF